MNIKLIPVQYHSTYGSDSKYRIPKYMENYIFAYRWKTKLIPSYSDLVSIKYNSPQLSSIIHDVH